MYYMSTCSLQLIIDIAYTDLALVPQVEKLMRGLSIQVTY